MYTRWHFFFYLVTISPWHFTIQLAWIIYSNSEARIEFKYPTILYRLFLQPIILYCKKSIRYASVTQYLSQTASLFTFLSLYYNVPKISGRIMNTFVKVLMWRTAEYCYTFFGVFKIRCKGRKVSTLIYSILIYWCFNLSNCP